MLLASELFLQPLACYKFHLVSSGYHCTSLSFSWPCVSLILSPEVCPRLVHCKYSVNKQKPPSQKKSWALSL